MHSKTILVSCGRTITLERASALFSSMDADVRALKVPPAQALSSGHGLGVDLLVIDDTDGGCDINGEPIDLTFMEYALLSFLVTHPGRIYSREVLLSQVWGFDYYGGSRTVDVHVRRLRAKLGPEVAQHIETVRGAGYLWQS